MTGALVLYAPNVGGGGGLVLLRELLGATWPVSHITAILDRRGQRQVGNLTGGIDVRWVDSNIGGRWRAERLLMRIARPGDLVLCFHNLPPVLPVAGLVLCYMQNANLVGLIPISHLSGWLRIRYAVERFIARRFRCRVDRYIVQTPTMATALRKWYGRGAPPIDVLPFVGSDHVASPRHAVVGGAETSTPQWDFLFVSEGWFHKNHRRLFAAWCLLAEHGAYPSLAVTLHPERDGVLREQVRRLVEEKGLQIYDLGLLPHHEALAAYHRAGALIFPSYAESFGIPLLEARAAGLPILAPELDYVRDICEPAVTFDPFSAQSIARAVLRFQGSTSDRVIPITTEAFVAALYSISVRNKSDDPVVG